MAKLTEDMVVARTRASDLSTIKKLNCWGGELQDISLLRRMSNVEVLSLSVNKISSLADVQFCKNLRELYVRKNEIKNLNEICYLKNLPHLKALWLGENPCSVSDNLYRYTVIRHLPTLEKLDDVKIELEERQDSMKKGRDLIHPEEYDYDNSSPVQSPVRVSRSPPMSAPSSDQDIEDLNETRKSYSPEYDQQTYTASETKINQGNDRYDSRNYKATYRPSEISYDQQYDNGVANDPVSIEKPIDPQCQSYLNRCSSDTSLVLKKEKSLTYSNLKVTHNSTNQEDSEGDCMTENKEGYCNCSTQHYDRRSQVSTSRCRDRGEGTRCSSSEGSGRTSPQKGQDRAYRQYDNYRIDGDRYSKGSPYPPRRPVTRAQPVVYSIMAGTPHPFASGFPTSQSQTGIHNPLAQFNNSGVPNMPVARGPGLQFNLGPTSQSPNQSGPNAVPVTSQQTTQGPSGTPNGNTNDSISSSQGSGSNTSGRGSSGTPADNTTQSTQASRDINTASLCKIGQETVQDIVSRTQEIFQTLKTIQPPNGTIPGSNTSNEKKAKIQEQLRTIRLLFKRLRLIYEKCNENTQLQGMEYTHIESLIPLKEEWDMKSEERKNSEAYRQASEECKELMEQVAIKNKHLKEIVDHLRRIIWEINTMLAMRRS